MMIFGHTFNTLLASGLPGQTLRVRYWSVLGLALAVTLSACAPSPEKKDDKPFTAPVFPAPPDEPRFYWERAIYGSADVTPEDPKAQLRRRLTGEMRIGQGMDKPYGVAVSQGRVYVGDTVGRHIAMFDLNKGEYKRFGDAEPGAVRMPFGIKVDKQGQVYVVDGSQKRVQVYDRDGKFITSLAKDRDWQRPVGLAIDDERNRLYVVDNGGVSSESHQVVALDKTSGRELFTVGKRGTGDGEFNLPRDVAVGKDGSIWVVDAGNFRIQVFSPEGKFVRRFGSAGRFAGNFSRPKEMAIDHEGLVYVIDTSFGNFQIFNAEAQLLLAVGSRSGGDTPAGYMLPSGIAVDKDGRVYVVDQGFRKVDVYRPASLKEGSGYGGASKP